MEFLKRWRKAAGHLAVAIVVALFAYFTLTSEANLANRHGVHLLPLDSAASSQ